MGGFNESGQGDFRLDVDGADGTYLHLQPAIDIASEIETANGMLIRPRLSFGITQFIGGTSPSVTARFAMAPIGVAPFTASTDLDKTRFDLSAGVDVFARDDLVVRADVFGSLSDHSESYGGGLKMQWAF